MISIKLRQESKRTGKGGWGRASTDGASVECVQVRYTLNIRSQKIFLIVFFQLFVVVPFFCLSLLLLMRFAGGGYIGLVSYYIDKKKSALSCCTTLIQLASQPSRSITARLNLISPKPQFLVLLSVASNNTLQSEQKCRFYISLFTAYLSF